MSSPGTPGQPGGHVAYRRWASDEAFGEGAHDGTTCRDGSLVIDAATGVREFSDPWGDGSAVAYEVASWISPEVAAGPPFTELVASWNAAAPTGTWIEISVEASTGVGDTRSTFVLGRWAETTSDIHNSSVPSRGPDFPRVDFDVLRAHPTRPLSTWRLIVSLLRRAGTVATPEVSLVGAVASGPPPTVAELSPSRATPSAATILAVPAYSQVLHRGEYPELGGGGEGWCSPASTSMVLAFWGRGPSPVDYAWVDESYPDRWVDHAAAHTFDRALGGAGNWSFNTAYAARFGVSAFVTRLRSLTEAESFVAAGIPLVASVSFTRTELRGAGYDTEGHLLVIVGFTPNGDVVTNDPASHNVASNDEVRAVYDRAEFERVWLTRSGGIVYVLHPADVALPATPEGLPANW